MQAVDRQCDIPIELIRFAHTLKCFTQSVARKDPVKIVAIGSSSTKGEGASMPSATYPARLEAELRLRFAGLSIDVINKGVGGEEAPEEAARLQKDVIAEKPTLVVWQVGTNAVWKNYDLDEVVAAIEGGLSCLASTKSDIALMDLQYAPALLAANRKPSAERMVDLIGDVADKAGINVFRRFALMRHWSIDDRIPFDQMISNLDANQLHQNDWSYNCVAQALADAIADATGRLV